MRIPGRTVFLAAAAALVAAAPLGAFTLVESNQKVPVAKGDTFSMQVTLPEAALCKGTHQLSPRTPYRVEIFSMGDGSVRASFFDQSGKSAGEANGIIAIIRRAAAAPPAGSSVPAVQSQGAAAAPPAGSSVPAVQSQGVAVQKIAPGSPSEQVALKFTKLGFGPNSRSSFSRQGQKLNLEILSQDGAQGIQIGLLVPAVQKVREAAAKPN